MKLNDIIADDKKYFMNTYGDRTPVCFDYGKGMKLWDIEGKEYNDFLAGIAVSVLGHSHPALVIAIQTQAEKLIHTSSLYYIKQQAELAKLLVENSCGDKVFFSNSGAEANEGAIKLARIYFNKKNMLGKYEIISLDKSFHGRTLATIAATGQDKYQKPYSPLTPSFTKVPMNDLTALESSINEHTCAVLIETIQGEGGINLTSFDYINGVRKLCDKYGILLIFDEIQVGLGRTGTLFAYEYYGIEPDIFTLAKALGGGFPIGAVIAKDEVASGFSPGDHGSTFGGNPLACSAGIAVLNTIINDKLVENSKNMGEYFTGKLSCLKGKYDFITEVRGKGLMIGIEFKNPISKRINDEMFRNRYLVGSLGDRIIRMLPPLIITKHDIDGFIIALDKVLNTI